MRYSWGRGTSDFNGGTEVKKINAPKFGGIFANRRGTEHEIHFRNDLMPSVVKGLVVCQCVSERDAFPRWLSEQWPFGRYAPWSRWPWSLLWKAGCQHSLCQFSLLLACQTHCRALTGYAPLLKLKSFRFNVWYLRNKRGGGTPSSSHHDWKIVNFCNSNNILLPTCTKNQAEKAS